jgi:hypothetical protein
MVGKKTVIVMAILAACVLLIRIAPLNIKTWQEEVQLLDGRVITVTQKRRLEGVYTGQEFGSIPREAWLTFNLPEFIPQQIVWHENLIPMVLNINNGKLFIVATPWTERELRQYGNPNPDYVGYRFENDSGHVSVSMTSRSRFMTATWGCTPCRKRGPTV